MLKLKREQVSPKLEYSFQHYPQGAVKEGTSAPKAGLMALLLPAITLSLVVTIGNVRIHGA